MAPANPDALLATPLIVDATPDLRGASTMEGRECVPRARCRSTTWKLFSESSWEAKSCVCDTTPCKRDEEGVESVWEGGV